MAVGQTFDLLICVVFGATNYEQVAVHQLKLALHSPPLLISTLLAVFISAPVIEEFLFRGLLQNLLKQYVSRKSALVIAAFFFAFIHISPAQGLGNISLFFSLFTFGCFLGFVYERQGSLLASIALHMTFNAITTLQILFIF
ncbi:MAG: CPBP family intramembrane glutamic endopeptidase [Chlamydiota bacterium]